MKKLLCTLCAGVAFSCLGLSVAEAWSLEEAAKDYKGTEIKVIFLDRPGYREFENRKWADLSAVMWGAMAVALAHQPDDLAALAEAVRVPMLIVVGSEDAPFVSASHAMADAIDGAQLVIVPNAGHSPQFENPQAWIDALSRFLASVPACVN